MKVWRYRPRREVRVGPLRFVVYTTAREEYHMDSLGHRRDLPPARRLMWNRYPTGVIGVALQWGYCCYSFVWRQPPAAPSGQDSG